MKLLYGLSTALLAAAGALAARIDLKKSTSSSSSSSRSVNVTIEAVGNSAVRATVTNNGSEPIRIYTRGTVLDSGAVEKAEVYLTEGTDQVAFDGVRLQISTQHLAASAFRTLAAGQSVAAEWDPAEVHDLSAGGDYDYYVSGTFQTADPDPSNATTTTSITGAIPYRSNVLTTHVNGSAAARVRRDFHAGLSAKLRLKARADLQDDCTGSDGKAQRAALTQCARLATAASAAASSGSAASLREYFKSATDATRATVAAVYDAVAAECGSGSGSGGGGATQYCTDVLGSCDDGVLAYTLPSRALMVSCPLYFDELPALSATCHQQDQATTTLHEVTHLTSVKGTQDYGYGYRTVRQLSAKQNLNNADTYTLFANAIEVGC